MKTKDDKFVLSVGQAHQLEVALSRAGWNAADLTAFMQNEALVYKTRGESWYQQGFIDCDRSAPKEWRAYHHEEAAKLAIAELKNMNFHKKDGNFKGGMLNERDRREWSSREPHLNRWVHNFLFWHKKAIPVEWNGMEIFFWGTLCRDEEGDHVVESLYQKDGKWEWRGRFLESSPGWDDRRVVYTEEDITVP